jgi:hypothetical protein
VRDEDILSLVFTILYVPGFIALFYLMFWMGRRARAAVARGDGLIRITRALRGEIARDPSFDGPFIRTKTRGHSTYCYQWLLFEGRSQLVTTFECRVGFPAFLEATSQGSLRYPTRFPRFREIQPESSFRIVTTDVRWAGETLDAGLRQILVDLGNIWSRARIQLAVDRFLVEVESGVSPDEAMLLAEIVHQVAVLGRATDLSAGVTFLDGVGVGLEGRCPVCGQAFEVAGVNCAQCKVPHHTDCWSYWGRCAIFGCRGQRITLPTSTSP